MSEQAHVPIPTEEIRHIVLGEALDQAASHWPDEIGWVFEDLPVSFAEMHERSIRTAHGLLALGIGPGDTVAALAPNIPEFAYLLFGASLIGAMITPINTRSKLVEITHCLVHGDAKLLVTTDLFLKQDYRAMLFELLGPEAISHDGVVQSKVAPLLRRIVGFPGFLGPGALPYEEFLSLGAAGGRKPPHPPAKQNWHDPVLLQYTSGTTAHPKGALLNHCMVLNYGIGIARGMGVWAGDAVLNTQPFYHVGGTCAALPLPLSLKCRMVIPLYYEPERVLALIERERCVARSGFASMYLMEIAAPTFKKRDISSLRAAWYNGPIELLAPVQKATGIRDFIQIYGATEGGGTNGRLEDLPEVRARNCGRPYRGTEVGIINLETGAFEPPGVTGEIVTRGWMQMNGYYKQPDETAKVLRPDGWLRMGDLGYLDEEGFLHFVGRVKNMIRVGGENVSAEEVEAFLLKHPKIKMAAVIGVPDDRLLEVVMAIIQIHPGQNLSAQDVMDYCSTQLANFRVPRYVRFIDEWPLTGSGKIHHPSLRERFVPTVQKG
ncbi:MAG: class I adenylate-forming enzyme family protein [Alphaproteobacteria bacterium]